jgi:hypothetical protein
MHSEYQKDGLVRMLLTFEWFANIIEKFSGTQEYVAGFFQAATLLLKRSRDNRFGE